LFSSALLVVAFLRSRGVQVQAKCREDFGYVALKSSHLLTRNIAVAQFHDPTNAQVNYISVEQHITPSSLVITDALDLHLVVAHTDIVARRVDGGRTGEHMPIAHAETGAMPGALYNISSQRSLI
jgi:hypothetical protein